MMQFRSRKDGSHYPVRQGSMPRGKPRRTLRYPSVGIRHEGSLTKHGYNLEEGEEKRHEAIDRAKHEYGYAETIRKLAALEGVNKGHPNHAKVKSDIEYLQREHGPKA